MATTKKQSVSKHPQHFRTGELHRINRRRVRDAMLDIYTKTGRYPTYYEIQKATGVLEADVKKHRDSIGFDDLREYWSKKTNPVLANLYRLASQGNSTRAIEIWLKYIERQAETVEITEKKQNIISILDASKMRGEEEGDALVIDAEYEDSIDSTDNEPTDKPTSE